MEFYISPQSGQFYMINVLENQWLSVTLRGIQEYIARDANNITRVEDEGNIVSIEGNIILYPPPPHTHLKEPFNTIILFI